MSPPVTGLGVPRGPQVLLGIGDHPRQPQPVPDKVDKGPLLDSYAPPKQRWGVPLQRRADDEPVPLGCVTVAGVQELDHRLKVLPPLQHRRPRRSLGERGQELQKLCDAVVAEPEEPQPRAGGRPPPVLLHALRRQPDAAQATQQQVSPPVQPLSL